jgi:hypothetical protein
MARIGFGGAERLAAVDHLLGAALDLRVAALHGIEVELGRVGAGGERAGGAAAHADAHAGAAELHELRAGGEAHLLGLRGGDGAEAAGEHDRLGVAAADARHRLLVGAEVAEQVRAAELVVEGGAAEGPVHHDLERARDVRRLAVRVALPGLGVRRVEVQVADGEAGEPGLGLAAAAGRALVADLAAGAGGGAGERRDRGRVVVRLDLHEHVDALAAGDVRARGAEALGRPALDLEAFHDGGVVGVGDDGPLRRLLVRRADHLEHRHRLLDAVDR